MKSGVRCLTVDQLTAHGRPHPYTTTLTSFLVVSTLIETFFFLLAGVVCVILAGAVIWWRPTWQVADPLVTLFFALIVVRTTMGFMGKAVNILLEGAPANVDIVSLKKGLESVEGVGDVHDIHVWELTADRPAMSCHVVLSPGATHDEVLMRCQDVCADDFDIDHATIQVQASHCRARTCCSQEHMSPDMGGRSREDSIC